MSLQSRWQFCRCKAGGSFVVAKLILLLQTCIPFYLQLPTSSLWRQVPVAAILHLWRHSDSDSPAVVNILLQINKSVNVLAYVCSQQGDIRTPHPNVKVDDPENYLLQALEKGRIMFCCFVSCISLNTQSSFPGFDTIHIWFHAPISIKITQQCNI